MSDTHVDEIALKTRFFNKTNVRNVLAAAAAVTIGVALARKFGSDDETAN